MTLAGMLAPFMQLVLDCSTAPEQFLEGVIIYMHKKSDPKDTNNYRGITLLSVVGKLTNKVIANRLISAAEEHELLHVMPLRRRMLFALAGRQMTISSPLASW